MWSPGQKVSAGTRKPVGRTSKLLKPSTTRTKLLREDWIFSPSLGRQICQSATLTRALDLLPEGTCIRLDRGYDSEATREKLRVRGLIAEISQKGKPAPLAATGRWIVERTNSWHNVHKKLVWCTERRGRVIDFWIAFSNVIIIVRRLIRRAWTSYRWESRPRRKP